MPETTVNLHRWCADTAADFRDMEQHEMAMYPSPDDRDAALAEWVVRVLANPKLAASAEVVAAISDRRNGGQP